MKKNLMLTFFCVFAASIPSGSVVAQHILTPLLWAHSVCAALMYLADVIREQKD
jgi:hypothetical protein